MFELQVTDALQSNQVKRTPLDSINESIFENWTR